MGLRNQPTTLVVKTFELSSDAEWLARRTSSEDIHALHASCSKDCSASRFSQIHHMTSASAIHMVVIKGRNASGVLIEASNYLDASIEEACGQATAPAEKINSCWHYTILWVDSLIREICDSDKLILYAADLSSVKSAAAAVALNSRT